MKTLLIAFAILLTTAPAFAGQKEIKRGIAGYKKSLQSQEFKDWVAKEKLDADAEAFFRKTLESQIALWNAELELIKDHPGVKLGSKKLINSALKLLLDKGLSEADLIQ